MVERRKHKRIKSPQLLPVLNANTSKQLGMLVDLSFSGLLMITTSDLLIDTIYQIQIVLPQLVGTSTKIEFAAEVAWADSPEENGACWTGFKIINISDFELERVGQLFDLWSLEQKKSVIQNN